MSFEYLLGIDGGGSKTSARLIHLSSEKQWESRGSASSLSLGVSLSLNVILTLANELAEKAGCDLKQVFCVCGLAGAGEKALKNAAYDGLDDVFGQVEIMTDARTSAYGANQGEPVAVVALGTGSVAMVLDSDGSERMLGGWGMLVGDEGGGARLGVNAIQAMLWEMDLYGKAKSATSSWLCQELGGNRSDILGWLRHATPTQFAGLAPGILERRHECPLAGQLFARHLRAVEKLIHACGDDLPLVLTGGLAEISADHLDRGTHSRLQQAKGTSLDGACLLARKMLTGQWKMRHKPEEA
ncbi:glucosamine kinase nucleotide-binding domain-containing protein [Bowmanella dokdonensis]|uniref:ATPase n=1 Tax=Bowmanella dokdonensis TaxID=751969 RepID=A0A939DMH4_9ALTE|nr:BadF/BadG/BcrA/BcrD ATPase family protein [Bowmanella dokdonensis]MBN7825320.1 ATPase [Bowmanella dokdonensis]